MVGRNVAFLESRAKRDDIYSLTPCTIAINSICLPHMASVDNDNIIFRRFCDNDPQAFNHIKQLIARFLARFSSRPQIEADDIESDVLYKLLAMRDRPAPQIKEGLSQLIATMVTNACYSRIKSENRKRELREINTYTLEALHTHEEPLSGRDKDNLHDRLRRFWAMVPPKCQELFRARAEKRTYAEIGVLIPGKQGQPRADGTIKKEVFICRAKAVEIWKKLGLDDQPFANLQVIWLESGGE